MNERRSQDNPDKMVVTRGENDPTRRTSGGFGSDIHDRERAPDCPVAVRALIFVFAWMVAGAGWVRGADTTALDPLRVGFSAAVFAGMNENDARAAIKGWGMALAREHKVPVMPEPVVLAESDTIREALSRRTVDAIGVLLTQYAAVGGGGELAPVFIAAGRGMTSERYVLLVRDDGPFRAINDLKGRRLLVHAAARMCLADIWLDLHLAEQGHGVAKTFFSERVRQSKSSQTVLPVFFGRADACLELRSGFDTMCELNPQLRARIRVLAESPEVVPLIFGIRDNYQPSYREQVVATFEEMHRTPSGQQALAMFRSERLIRCRQADLEPSMDLIRRHARLAGAGAGGGSGQASTSAGSP